ncbi:MAG: hypothetical protein R3A79_14210 [Nannocystaceae bacterium]
MLRPTLVLALPLALALTTTACDDAFARAELEAARVELEAATRALRDAEERLAQATSELTAAREELAARARTPDPASLRRLGVVDDETEASTEDLAEAAAAAIQCPEVGRCTITRAFLSEAIANPAGLARQARVVPALRDGETYGFKLYGIRRGSLPKLLGLKNGDALTTVNGRSLASMDDAMTAYAELRDETELNLTVERKAELFALKITITD